MTGDYIRVQIDNFWKTHKEKYLEKVRNGTFLFVPLYSAELFADIIIGKIARELNKPSDDTWIIKQSVSTYNDWKSTGNIQNREELDMYQGKLKGKEVLIVEDMRDTGSMLVSLLWIFQAILEIQDDFIVGFWIDFKDRIFAVLDGIYQVPAHKIDAFIMETNSLINTMLDKGANIAK
jgi:hypothetical protein